MEEENFEKNPLEVKEVADASVPSAAAIADDDNSVDSNPFLVTIPPKKRAMEEGGTQSKKTGDSCPQRR